MLLRWRQISTVDIEQKTKVTEVEEPVQYKSKGNMPNATIAASEEILKTLANNNQMAIMARPIIQLKLTATAMDVATPLPPLKWKNNG